MFMKKNVLEVKELLTQTGYLYFGHGTGRSNSNLEKTVESIFSEGLGCRHNSLENTSCVLHTGGELSFEPFLERINNWGHFDSKKIIIFRFPVEYINLDAEMGDICGEQYFAFYKQIEKIDGIKFYVDTKFIVGCYDANTKEFELNPNFEEVLSEQIKEELSEKLVVAKNSTKERKDSLERRFCTPILTGADKKIETVTLRESLGELDDNSDGWN